MSGQFVVVRDREGKTEERVNFADLYNTWNRNFELSNTYQVSFTMRYIPGYETVFNLARQQAEVLFGGQSYKIKELEAVANENGVVTKKVTAQNGLIDRLKNIILPDQDTQNADVDDSGDDSDAQQPGTVIKQTGMETTYSLDQVMHMFVDNNDQGVSYELHGNFLQQPVKVAGSLYSFLTSSLMQFGGYWIPDGNTVKIYDLPSITHKTGETFRYLYDTPNVDIQSSTMDMVNSVQVQAGKMEETTTAAANTPVSKNAQGVIDYAKSWLGRPYILGGRTEEGTGCAGFVHFVYAQFGINVGWNTWALEPSFQTVSSPQTGDVGFYGVPGNPYHVCLFLDANTIIFEPQPGEVCKMEPASWFYPNWVGRNDQMAAIVGGGGSGDVSSSRDYYGFNYTYTDNDSTSTYDLHRGDLQTLDSIYDQNAANAYLSSHLQTDPAASMTFSHKGKCNYNLGDSIFTIAPEMNIATDMVVFSFSLNDFNPNADATINFNSTGKAMQDVNKALLDKIRNVTNRPVYYTSGRDTGGRYENHFNDVVTVTEAQAEAAKQFTEGDATNANNNNS